MNQEESKAEALSEINHRFSQIRKLLDAVETDLYSDNIIKHNKGYLYAMTIIDFFHDITANCQKMFDWLKKEGVINFI